MCIGSITNCMGLFRVKNKLKIPKIILFIKELTPQVGILIPKTAVSYISQSPTTHSQTSDFLLL